MNPAPLRASAGEKGDNNVEYESPEIIATYVEDELAGEAAVSTTYGQIILPNG